MDKPISKTEYQQKSFAEFLESTPPNNIVEVVDLYTLEMVAGGTGHWLLSKPDIQLFCNSPSCSGLRFFQCMSQDIYVANMIRGTKDRYYPFFLKYLCRNCLKTEDIKHFAMIALSILGDGAAGLAVKIGEVPPFGPSTPSRLISLVGPDRDAFIKGRRAENHGLGIGAFAYYRRVVENQKARFINEIAKVARRLGATESILLAFEKAAQETQFSRAIDDIKNAIPSVLLIQGQNPLVLLHSALSEGIHAQSDEKCLEMAQDVRLVLTELAERISQALRDDTELKQAVSRLLKREQHENVKDKDA